MVMSPVIEADPTPVFACGRLSTLLKKNPIS